MIGFIFIWLSNFITDRDPFISQIIPSPKYLEVEPIGNQFFNESIGLARLLTLSPPQAEDQITFYSILHIFGVSFDANYASLFGMLQVESMPFGYFLVYCAFHPCEWVYDVIFPFLQQFYCQRKFRVDRPNQEESILLQFFNRDIFDSLIA